MYLWCGMAEKTRSTWKLGELADEAGVSARTIRYYVQRGLLPAPPFKGPDTVYGPEHLLRLKAIRRLQQQYLPLDAIQAELLRRSAEQLRDLVNAPEEAKPRQIVVPPAAPPLVVEYHSRAQPEHWERWELVPGVELHVSERADRHARELAEKLRREVEEEGRR